MQFGGWRPGRTIDIVCPDCNNRHDQCGTCGGSGRLTVRNASNVLDHGTAQLLELYDAWEVGIPPVAGGALDQTDGILDAFAFIKGEHSQWHNHQMEQLRDNR